MNKPLLHADQLYKSFHQGSDTVEVLKGVTFSVHANEIVALMGASGSGKSTLLHALGLLEPIDRGHLLWKGERLEGMSEKERTQFRGRHLGFLYQRSYLIPEFTTIENVMIPFLIRGVSKKEAYQQASELLSHVQLDHRYSHYPSQLSGGEQHRAALARSLAKRRDEINDGHILLADEPTGNLDEEMAHTILDVLIETVKKSGWGAVIATHDLGIAKRMDRIIRLHRGKIVV